MSILTWIIIGLIAGWFASLLVKDGGIGFIGNVAISIAGGALAGWIVTSLLRMGKERVGGSPDAFLLVFFGAFIITALLRSMSGSKHETQR